MGEPRAHHGKEGDLRSHGVWSRDGRYQDGESTDVWLPGLRGARAGKRLPGTRGVFFQDDGNVLELDGGVIRHDEHAECH